MHLRGYRLDALLAAAVAVPVAVPFATAPEVTAWGALFNVGTVVPLVWRRRAPFATALLVAAAATLTSLHHRPGQMLQYGGLVAMYTLADQARPWQRRTFLIGFLVTTPPATILIKHNSAPEFLFTLLLPLTAYVLGSLARVSRARSTALALRAAELERSATAQAARAAAEERARIARDMHDVLAHAVAVMVVQAEAGPVVVRTDPDRAERAFDAVAEAGRDALVQLRRSLGVLKDPADVPALAPQPTLARIPDLVARVRSTGLRVELTVDGDPAPLPLDAELAAYRIVQEGLTNTVKHAAATTATVGLTWTAAGLTVSVENNAPGDVEGPTTVGERTIFPHQQHPVDVEGAPPRANGTTTRGPRGQGLVGVAQRAASCGGHAAAGATPGGGFRLTAWLPTTPTVRA